MNVRALARPRMLQHAGRVIAVAAVAATIVVSASPAGAWESYWQRQSAVDRAAIRASETAPIAMEFAPFEWTGFREVSAFELAIAAIPSTELKASMASALPQSSTGGLIASTALSFVGYPYIYGGAGPGGFDCSGFTQYIIGISTGIWMSHAVESQAGSTGSWVDYGNWQPGDLVYFQNTYRPGISHAGIYIGDGLFVHAENESTGVTIDSMYSSYYAPRYWGAFRVG